MTNSNVNLQTTTAGVANLKSLTVVASGANELKLTSGAGSLEAVTVSGGGSLNLGEVALTALKTVTSTAAGGITVNATGGILETVTTGDGKDSITAVGATVKNISTGAGNDTVSSIATALKETAVIDLGAGDDKLSLAVAPTAGVTLSGGEGTDTLAAAKAAYATISGFSDANRAKISGFEVLEITDVLGTADSIDLSKLAGLGSFTAADGVTTTETAAVTGVTSGSTITLAGAVANNGTLNVTVKDAAAGTADVLNVVLNKAIADTPATPGVKNAVAITLGAADVESINIDAKGVKAVATSDDLNNYTVVLNDAALKTLTVTGDQFVTYVADATQTKLATIDAGANTAGVSIDTSAATLTQSITITGTSKADTFTLGARDIVTGNGGDDTFTISTAASPTGQLYATIQDGTKGDVLDFAAAVTKGAKLDLADTAVFQDYLDAGAAGNATNVASWFSWAGDTYVVVDRDVGASFTNGTDVVVKLTGGIDLSLATVSAGDLVLG